VQGGTEKQLTEMPPPIVSNSPGKAYQLDESAVFDLEEARFEIFEALDEEGILFDFASRLGEDIAQGAHLILGETAAAGDAVLQRLDSIDQIAGHRGDFSS
jgi:hypothetical protein